MYKYYVLLPVKRLYLSTKLYLKQNLRFELHLNNDVIYFFGNIKISIIY